MEQIPQPEIEPVSSARPERVVTRARPRTVSKWDAHQGGQVGAESSRALTMLHESFARNLAHALSAFLRIPFEASLASAAFCTYREHLQRLPELTYLAACKLQPADVSALLQLDLSVAFSLIDLLLGGEGKGTLEPRDVTEIEELVLENVGYIICRELGTAWQALGAEFRFDGRQQKVKASRLMSPEDRVLVLSFNVTLQEIGGSLLIAVPAAMAATLLRKLSAEWSYRRPPAPAESKERVKTSLLNCPFDADLRAVGLRIPAKDLMNIRPGDLLVFGQAVDSPNTLFVGDQAMFQAFVMRHQGRRVAQLLKVFPRVQAEGKEAS